MSLLTTVLAFLVALGVLIIVHEYGHYAVARLCGVKVLRFSVGFGRPLVTKRFSAEGTEWVIAALPFGGYVKMVDEREGDVAPRDLPFAFNRKSVWRRFLIVLAGPAANLLLAVVLYWGLFMIGVPDARPVISAPTRDSVAERAGLMRGDTLLSIDGEKVEGWQEARWRLMKLALTHARARLQVQDQRGYLSDKTLDMRELDLDGMESDPIARLGLRLYRPDAVIGRALPESVAEKSGLRRGDRILEVDGRPISGWDEFVLAVRSHPGESMRLRIENGGGQSDMTLTPDRAEDRGKSIGRIGAEPLVDTEQMKALFTVVRFGPAGALRFAALKTWDTSVFSLGMMGKMITREVSWRNLSGPVTIADYAGQSAQAGWGSYIAFLAIISISLGVLNLLPIPLLDGGHLLYYVVEVLKGSPVSDKALELGQRVGLSVLLFLMVFAFYNDINRLFSG